VLASKRSTNTQTVLRFATFRVFWRKTQTSLAVLGSFRPSMVFCFDSLTLLQRQIVRVARDFSRSGAHVLWPSRTRDPAAESRTSSCPLGMDLPDIKLLLRVLPSTRSRCRASNFQLPAGDGFARYQFNASGRLIAEALFSTTSIPCTIRYCLRKPKQQMKTPSQYR